MTVSESRAPSNLVRWGGPALVHIERPVVLLGVGWMLPGYVVRPEGNVPTRRPARVP